MDVGCGDRPKGDVNIDLYKTSSIHLYEDRIIHAKATPNFVCASIYNLPFSEQVFSKVLCHHLLEHLHNPIWAIKELMRVSNCEVEIIVPSKWHELIQNRFLPKRREWATKHHLWHFNKAQLSTIFSKIDLHPTIKYRYKFSTALRNFKVFQIRDFKQFLVYGILEAILPPTPGELIVTIKKPNAKVLS